MAVRCSCGETARWQGEAVARKPVVGNDGGGKLMARKPVEGKTVEGN